MTTWYTQPPPTTAAGDVWQEVIDDEADPQLRAVFTARRAFGFERYGTPLQRDNGRDHVADMLDEAVDLVAYARAARRPDVEAIARGLVLLLVSP